MTFRNCIKIIAQLVHTISLALYADLGKKSWNENSEMKNYEININSVCFVYIIFINSQLQKMLFVEYGCALLITHSNLE